MGKRGPAPTPTAKLEKRGSWRAKTRNDEPEGQSVKSASPPRWISKEGKKIWKKVFPIVSNMGIMKESDITALARYCDSMARYKNAQSFIQEHGETYSTTNKFGEEVIKLYPQGNLLLKLEPILIRLEQHFGLTQIGRAHV